MLTDLQVKMGPSFYQYHIGALQNIPKLLKEYHAENILIVHGTISWEKAKPFLSFIDNFEGDITYHQYTGECSYYGADLIKDIVEKQDIDFIIGVGGGKLTDLVGYAAHIANVPFGVVPTLASNCAPWTPLSVMYKESGESEGKSEHFLRQAAFLITDPELVIDSPVEYFVAGLADTIAKWYESDAILKQAHLQKENYLQLAQHITVLSKDQILNDAAKAIEDMKNQVISDEFYRLSEIVFAIAGMVGGLGGKYSRNAAAHAMHDGLGKYYPAVKKYLHGEIVAYGILYQMAIEKRWADIDELIPLYNELNLPKSLKEMHIEIEEGELLDNLVEFIDSKEKVHLIPLEINQSVLKSAILELENYINK
ncbi:iron-containing alcohol dehydrogenase family protein [Globicatella sanguinis]|uniref:iron-containing alcohol dehydrogenase family protein n=1 Tax=Globicatella sanguinis TaxID=13076 RepID=UPI0025427F0E|nr:iron-containing alcohol dehydrogenase family protein [Globicatella sanguinis]MDK7631502.1 iron-containing alcohol dehydrogenase family protein [Globicatella sanguinis]WIK67083.1 iron-containing alcohol dehydrogenase family protein [Globicatella sanguinis]WKT56488.1 iron-containing alcohol dehydrogenase family protein [Globicatella sanguinis]